MRTMAEILAVALGDKGNHEAAVQGSTFAVAGAGRPSTRTTETLTQPLDAFQEVVMGAKINF